MANPQPKSFGDPFWINNDVEINTSILLEALVGVIVAAKPVEPYVLVLFTVVVPDALCCTTCNTVPAGSCARDGAPEASLADVTALEARASVPIVLIAIMRLL
jgi:hypothetical protein